MDPAADEPDDFLAWQLRLGLSAVLGDWMRDQNERDEPDPHAANIQRIDKELRWRS